MQCPGIRLNLGVKVEYRQTLCLLYPLSLFLTIFAYSKLYDYLLKAFFSLPIDIQWVKFSTEFSSRCAIWGNFFSEIVNISRVFPT